MDERESRCRNNRGEIPFAKGSIRSRNSRFEYLIQKKKKKERKSGGGKNSPTFVPPHSLLLSSTYILDFSKPKLRANKSRILKLELYFHGE